MLEPPVLVVVVPVEPLVVASTSGASKDEPLMLSWAVAETFKSMSPCLLVPCRLAAGLMVGLCLENPFGQAGLTACTFLEITLPAFT